MCGCAQLRRSELLTLTTSGKELIRCFGRCRCPRAVDRPDGQPRISCASCTTNCITPVIEIAPPADRRRVSRDDHGPRLTTPPAAGGQPEQQLPTRPGSSRQPGPRLNRGGAGHTRALPELTGRFDGVALRAPIPVGSIADIVFVASRATTAEEVNDAFRHDAATERYQGILGVSEDPLVSADIGDPRAAVADLELTRVVDGTLVKVMAWYESEWGFTHQMIREARSILVDPAPVPLR
jgi:glyceraldehyde 3-phosphate dehydrogenase